MNIIVLPYLFFFTRVVTASLLLIIALLLSQTVAQPLAHCGHAPHRLPTPPPAPPPPPPPPAAAACTVPFCCTPPGCKSTCLSTLLYFSEDEKTFQNLASNETCTNASLSHKKYTVILSSNSLWLHLSLYMAKLIQENCSDSSKKNHTSTTAAKSTAANLWTCHPDHSPKSNCFFRKFNRTMMSVRTTAATDSAIVLSIFQRRNSRHRRDPFVPTSSLNSC